jgi:hypothetical protein
VPQDHIRIKQNFEKLLFYEEQKGVNSNSNENDKDKFSHHSASNQELSFQNPVFIQKSGFMEDSNSAIRVELQGSFSLASITENSSTSKKDLEPADISLTNDFR